MGGVRFNEEQTQLLEKILDKLLEVKEIVKGMQVNCKRMQQSYKEEENGPIAEDEIVQEEKKNAELQICFHDQATEEEVFMAVEGDEINTRRKETKARDPAFKLEISSCVNVWQHDRVEINTPSYTSLTRISATTKQIFSVEGIPNEGPRMVWHPPWTWDVTHSPSNPKKLLQTIAATQPIRVESLVSVHQQTHTEIMLLREKFLDSPFLAFKFRMGEKQSHFFKVVGNETGEKPHHSTWMKMKMANAGLEDLAAATFLASIWMSDCWDDKLMSRMMELQWREILRELTGHGVDASRNIQPPSQVDPNAYVVNSFTRRPHMQEPVGHCNPAWNFQETYNLIDNISLQQGIEPRRPLFFFAQQLGSWLVQVCPDLHLYAMFLLHLQAQRGNHLNRRDVQMAFHNYEEVEADMTMAALPMDERRTTIIGLIKFSNPFKKVMHVGFSVSSGQDSYMVVLFCNDVESRSPAGYADFGPYDLFNYFVEEKGKGRMEAMVIGEVLKMCAVRWSLDSVDALGSTAHAQWNESLVETIICLLPSDKGKGKRAYMVVSSCEKEKEWKGKGNTLSSTPQSMPIIEQFNYAMPTNCAGGNLGVAREPELKEWTARTIVFDMLQDPVRIAMVGKYTGLSGPYLSVLRALLHAYVAWRRKLIGEWVATCDLEDKTGKKIPYIYKIAWNCLNDTDRAEVVLFGELVGMHLVGNAFTVLASVGVSRFSKAYMLAYISLGKKIILVFDPGGWTFDVSLVSG